MGKCWVQIPVCTLNPAYAGIGDEFQEAYSELGVGESEQACLSRAEYHWQLCGSNPFHQVIMTFLPSGASASFPDDAAVERQHSSRHAFYRLAKWVGTDKVGPVHSFYHAYEKYLAPRRTDPVRLLEIGLGCNMGYGPGASARLWRQYFRHPRAELWEAEADAACAARFQHVLEGRILVGDQGDVPTLHRWISESGGAFDFIIDDGGHFNTQILSSFRVLFPLALKPGGTYFIEDLACSRQDRYQDSHERPIDKIKDWVDAVTMAEDFPPAPGGDVEGILSIECFKGMCAVNKCPDPASLPPGQTCP